MSTSSTAAIATLADITHADTAERVPPAGAVAMLAGWSALEGWQEPRAGRCRRLGRPSRLLRMAVTPVSSPGLALDAATLGALVAACAHRLRASVRATDHVARVGDHGMAVLLDGADDAGAQAAAERLQRVCQGPYRIGEQRLALRVLVDLERPNGAGGRR